MLQPGGSIHTGIDSENGIIYLINEQGLWSYSIPENNWDYLSGLSQLPKPLRDLESGFDSASDTFYFWDTGVGSVYELDLDDGSFNRIDNSHPHRNQYTHYPFFKDGTVHAFGGYGYWSWKSYITYFNTYLKEWSIQEVAPNSTIPSARVVNTGIYIPQQQELFTFGGWAPENELRADDPSTEMETLRDIWKFSFEEKEWHKEGVIDSDLEHYPNPFYRSIFTQNKITGSFYSSKSNIWYIPAIEEDLNEGMFFLPVHTLTSDTHPAIQLESDLLRNILPTNFLMDQNESMIYIVGLNRVAEPSDIPIRIVKIPEDSLLSEIEKAHSDSYIRSLLIYGITVPAFLVLLFFLFRSKKNGKKQAPEEAYPDLHNLDRYSWLKTKEKMVLEQLMNERSGLDSEELEERVWPETDSYDYRRKLRNETIRAINSKFKKHFKKSDNIIIRIKDEQDKRRYLYKINEGF
ncbi:hypothetical protein [Rhodohalobacter mucosus]|uniref:hypothetical protein n=1 Tax=Rhodohalobacter mucosus TaxID=2079485 RepID=UPI0011B21F5D|nr:hypothetical protein [Rhodohalobacter mucosus]